MGRLLVSIKGVLASTGGVCNCALHYTCSRQAKDIALVDYDVECVLHYAALRDGV